MPGLLEHGHEGQLFQGPRGGYFTVVRPPLPLFFPLGLPFPFPRPGEDEGEACWRNARGKSSTSFAGGDDGQVATCQLDVVEALASIKIGCKGTVVLLSLLLWVYWRNFITIVGCIIVKPVVSSS